MKVIDRHEWAIEGLSMQLVIHKEGGFALLRLFRVVSG